MSRVFLTVLLVVFGIISLLVPAGCSPAESTPTKATTTPGQTPVAIETGNPDQQAQSGDYVSLHYTLKLQDGAVYETTENGQPLEFTIGQGQTLPDLENAVVGMKAGESKTVNIPVDQAFGPYRNDLIQVVSRDRMAPDLIPEVGMQLQTYQNDGSVIIVTVTEVTDTTITIDANAPLAGKDLTFEIKLVEIQDSTRANASSAISGLTMESLEQALSNGKPTLAELGSVSCIPCKQMKPILEQLAVDYKDKLNVVIIDVYDQPKIGQQYKVMAIPTQVVFDGSGKEVARHVGLWPGEQIIAQLNKLGIK